MRVIPIALQDHLDTGATTTTLIMRIEPRIPGFAPLGCTMLDRDIVYDDGRGELTYHGVIGYTPANISAKSDMGADNTEGQHLIPEVDMGIDEKVLNSGAYDFADFWLMLVNYEDLSQGHAPIMRGQLGQIRVQDGLTFWSELTSLSKQLKQRITAMSSKTCRATFGSQYPGTEDAEYVERQPCRKDYSGLWVSSVVTSVGDESNRTFGASALGASAGAFMPGMVKWTSGDNAGRQYDVEDQSGAGVISLVHETMFPIQVGDTFDIRPDCTKWWDGVNGCQFHFGDDWVMHYRGEPYLKPEDSDSAIIPGAAVR